MLKILKYKMLKERVHLTEKTVQKFEKKKIQKD